MAQSPQYAVIRIPAQQGRKNCTDAANDPPAATPTSRPILVFSHVLSVPANTPVYSEERRIDSKVQCTELVFDPRSSLSNSRRLVKLRIIQIQEKSQLTEPEQSSAQASNRLVAIHPR